MIDYFDTPLVSIIIRTKNEERWIKALLTALREQTYQNYEIIIIDNESVDKTVQIAKNHDIKKIIKIKKYNPSAALNMGVSIASGEICVFLSAHCIPATSNWLAELIKPICQAQSVCSYGRQIPTSNSSPDNARDLLMTFGKEPLLQTTDFKFHNANSAIITKVVKKTKFDETLTNIEDWHWAKVIIEKGYNISYNPEAVVFHDHGIHQHSDELTSFRADPVARLLIEAYKTDTYPESFFEVNNWSGLIIVSGTEEQSVIKKIQSSFDQPIIVNAKLNFSDISSSVTSVAISDEVDFHNFLKEMLLNAEKFFDRIFDYIIFLDYAYENIDFEIAKKNSKQLFQYWADVASHGRKIKGKTLAINNGNSLINSEIFPSNQNAIEEYELTLGQGGAMRSHIIRLVKNQKLRYRLVGSVDSVLGHKY